VPDIQVFHASSVALGGRGVLILGASGTGKSSLALHLMALGAALVSDDRTVANRASNGQVLLSAPEAIRGRIEARGVGILQAETEQNVPLALVVDLDRSERDRLPPDRTIEVLGKNFPVLNNPGSLHFPHAILQYLKAGRSD
jgi:HPr kinase/phosphorylase